MVALLGGFLVPGIWLQTFVDSGEADIQWVQFNRDIRPIFNQHCVSCHGGVKQQGNVSLIYREEVLGVGKSGRPTVVARKPNQSELIARVTSDDPEYRMPYEAPQLSEQQIGLLRQWIEQGAQWDDHWAFVPPKPVPVPDVRQRDWVRQPVDSFILARLESEQLSPSGEAGKAALLRRVSFDLTGLPPSESELQQFLSDSSPDAYTNHVDRLLASPAFGERWATMWLDLARYADSKGYSVDNARDSWPYRDWVIDAFSANIPYDQFVTKQLAGDMIPDASLDDLIATSFHRQTLSNDEGGTYDEEFRLAAVMDRVATTWSVLNGVSMNCVQCHSHPYDPIRHEEYYTSIAFFNSSEDSDDQFDDRPVLHVPVEKRLYPRAQGLQKEIRSAIEDILSDGRLAAEDLEQWADLTITQADTKKALGMRRQWSLFEEQGPYLFAELGRLSPSYRKNLTDLFFGESEGNVADAEVAADAPVPFDVRDGEAWATANNIGPAAVSEFLASGDSPVLTALRIEFSPVDPETARHTPEEGFSIERIDAWRVDADGQEQKLDLRFVPDSNDHLTSQHALIGLSAVGRKSMAEMVVPGPPSISEQVKKGALQVKQLRDTRWIVAVPDEPVLLTAGSRIKVQLTHNNDLAIVAASSKPTVARRVRIVGSAKAGWTRVVNNPRLQEKIDRVEELYLQLSEIPTVQLPVMVEQSPYEQRETLRFERGNFLAKIGPRLEPGVPALFPEFLPDIPHNRLTMARWFFEPGQPLTARVAVNRFWEQLFGVGIVQSMEDFGSAGDRPSHPELLDWLALHFQHDLDWDVKALLRELVLSATYRQSARVSEGLLEVDPYNRLLARGARQRLSAEMVRDQALFASGLLETSIGGPPVMPPLPAGVELSLGMLNDSAVWTTSEGGNRYRRALYTRVQRSNPYPSPVIFDAPVRDASAARRISTNTPLQPLVTLNDPVYQEAAEALARRLLNEPVGSFSDGDTGPLEARLRRGARLVLSRDLTSHELQAMRGLYRRALGSMTSSVTVPETKSVARSENEMALTVVCSALLNFESALTR